MEKDHTVAFDHLMRADARLDRYVRGIWDVHAAAGTVEAPAVVGAADRIAFDAAAGEEMRAKMGANVIDQAKLSVRASE